MMFIDQKRAHERILYERYIDCLTSNTAVSQTDLFPVKVELDPSDFLLLKESHEELQLLGFTLEFTDDYNIVIKGCPTGSGSFNPAGMLEIIIEEYKSAGGNPRTGAKEKLAAGMAAASAIQYGKALGNSEMENLFDALFACSAPNYSPKGKAVIIIMTLDELDKKFK